MGSRALAAIGVQSVFGSTCLSPKAAASAINWAHVAAYDYYYARCPGADESWINGETVADEAEAVFGWSWDDVCWNVAHVRWCQVVAARFPSRRDLDEFLWIVNAAAHRADYDVAVPLHVPELTAEHIEDMVRAYAAF